jgi:hypothetical protein
LLWKQTRQRHYASCWAESWKAILAIMLCRLYRGLPFFVRRTHIPSSGLTSTTAWKGSIRMPAIYALNTILGAIREAGFSVALLNV